MGILAEANLLEVRREKSLAFLSACALATIAVWRRMCRALLDEVKAAGGSALVWTELRGGSEGPGVAPNIVSLTCKASHVAKILQTQRQYAMLLHILGRGHVQVRFDVPCWLQSLSRTTGEAY